MAHYLYQRGPTFYAAYTDAAGVLHRVSTGTTDKVEAQRFLDTKVIRAEAGLPVTTRFDKVLWRTVADDLRRHYAATGKRERGESERRFRHLDGFLGKIKVAQIKGDLVTCYVAHRQAEGAAASTINRELGVLSKALRLAVQNEKLAAVPPITWLKEAAPRSGFFERNQFEAVRAHLPEELRPVITIQYTYGWRTSEVLFLERRHLDLQAGTLRLDPGTTKNGDGRVVHLTSELKAMLAAHDRRLGSIDPHARLFSPNRLENYWSTACRKAGVEGRTPHDFRRTAVRNMEQSGVPRSVAMKITGHRGESIYRRYAIVSDVDLQSAAGKIESLHSAQESATHRQAEVRHIR